MTSHTPAEIEDMQGMIGDTIDQFPAEAIIEGFACATKERRTFFLMCVVRYALGTGIIAPKATADDLPESFEADAERLHRLIAEGDCAAASDLLREMAPSANLRTLQAEKWLADARNAPSLPFNPERTLS